jgi:septal ring factor EnvC (AmiA/AmiB activator)
MNKPARPERTRAVAPVADATSTTPTAAPAPKKERKPRAPSTAGDFNAELRALADKHRKKSAKLRSTVSKLEGKLSGYRAQLDKADEPLRKIERVLADHPGLPGLEDTVRARDPEPVPTTTDEQLVDHVASAWAVTPAVDHGEVVP